MTILQEMSVGHAPPLVPLTVEQYHDMISAGILRDGDPVELIDGILVCKDRSVQGGDPMTHYPAHAVGVSRLARRWRLEDHGYYLRVKLPLTLSGTREPEPDLALVRGSEEDYQTRHPAGADTVAVAEVADSSLTFDRTTKLRLYASAAIPTYWIVNLVDNMLEVYQDPQPVQGVYSRHTDHVTGETVTLTLESQVQITVAVAELLPR